MAGSDGQVFGTSEGPEGFLGGAAGGYYRLSPIGLPGYHQHTPGASGGYQPQLSGPISALAVPNLALRGSMAPPNTMSQGYQRPGGDLQDYPPRAPLPRFQGPDFALEGSMGRPSGNHYYDQQPEAGFEEYPPRGNAPLQPFQGPGFELGGPMARPSGISQYYQQPEAGFEEYPPWSNAPLHLFGGSGFVPGESTAPPNWIPQYQLGGYPAPVNGPWSSLGAPDLALGESVAQLMNSNLDTEYMFSDLPPPSTGDGLWLESEGTGPSLLDEQAAARVHFAELDAIEFPGRQGG